MTTDKPQAPLNDLLASLDLSTLSRDDFQAPSAGPGGPVFGGLMMAQSLVAAGRTVGDARCHSLHGYFLRPGKGDQPITFKVQRLRDGKSLAQRRVVASQSGEELYTSVVSFGRDEEGFSHARAMPEAPGPEGLPDWEDLRALSMKDPAMRRDAPVEVRVCDPDSADPAAMQPPRRRVWIRPCGSLPPDPLIHCAVVAFVSDRTLLRTAARPHGPIWQLRTAVSIDHALWLHQAFRFDDWLLYACDSPVARGGRGLALGEMYTRDGNRVATSAQEGILRF